MPAPEQAQPYRDSLAVARAARNSALAACDAARVRVLRVAAAELGALPEGRAVYAASVPGGALEKCSREAALARVHAELDRLTQPPSS